MPSRYTKSKFLENDVEFYEFLRKKRSNTSSVTHMATVTLTHPNALERASLRTTNHIWKYGDRFYNLAYRYYDNPEYWWIIAWYNGTPTEANVNNGDLISIPLDIEEVLMALGVY